MSFLTDVVAGWTGRLGPFTLRKAGTPFSLTGYTVTAIIRQSNGVQSPTGGTVVIDADQVTNPGRVYYDPVATDFVWNDVRGPVVQSHTIHWKVMDGAGKIVFFPNGDGDEIAVHRQ